MENETSEDQGRDGKTNFFLEAEQARRPKPRLLLMMIKEMFTYIRKLSDAVVDQLGQMAFPPFMMKQLYRCDSVPRASFVKNRLHHEKDRMGIEVPVLHRNNHTANLTLSHEHVNWGNKEWSHVMFSDEPKFSFWPDGKHIRVWHQPGSAARLHHVQEVHSYRGGSIMVWIGVMKHRKTVQKSLEQKKISDDRRH
ncbi:hypothetical protein ANN_22171 [Periplaneta americana]|uniref:Uncharacterized protein n=1 Tax=Periplaneta americana TaxID=6978 RepID=A0ABQ8S8C9_PERAM|nr:hypothetical protein ANN_22171 [Periplaneta americana]